MSNIFLFLDPIGEDTQETEDKEGDDGKEGRWILGRVSRSLFFFSLPKTNITPQKVRVSRRGGRFAGVMSTVLETLFCCNSAFSFAGMYFPSLRSSDLKNVY